MAKLQIQNVPIETPLLQRVVQRSRRFFPRGWAPLLMALARVTPQLQAYPARMLDGSELFLDLRETMCFSYFFYGELPHERATTRLLSTYLSSGGSLVDIGANVGYFTCLASRIVGPSGAVKSFEPSPQALPLLHRNVLDLENVEVRAIALGSELGQADFYIKSSGDTSSLEPEPGSRKICVEMSTLDYELRAVPSVDLIKIDVEGFEIEVLRGAKQTLLSHRCPVYFEIIPDYLKRKKIDLGEFHAFLRNIDYVHRWVNLGAGDETDFFQNSPSTYVLALPAETVSVKDISLDDNGIFDQAALSGCGLTKHFSIE